MLLIPFNYLGGKFRHADWIIAHLPKTTSYVEVFGGSGIVLLNKPPCRIETLNDRSQTVVNFFRVLRDPAQREQLLEKIWLTPYAQDEYMECYTNMNTGGEVERAWKFFVTVCQSFNGTYTRPTGWKISTVETRALISESVNRWLTKIPQLLPISERLRRVQISNMDFRVVFRKFDSVDTLFYCDPPYLAETRCERDRNEYEHEMSDGDHEEFLKLAMTANGKVAISGYDSELYNDTLKGFAKIVARRKRSSMMHSERQEVLWTNYDPMEALAGPLFREQKTKVKGEKCQDS